MSSVGRDSDSLGVGRFGNRIPVEIRLNALVQTKPGARSAPSKMGTGSLSRKQRGQGEALTTHLYSTYVLL
jgi:hypothetical protein